MIVSNEGNKDYCIHLYTFLYDKWHGYSVLRIYAPSGKVLGEMYFPLTCNPSLVYED